MTEPGLTEGIIGLMNKGQPRGLDDWGTLRAWAWGASRAIDYLETDPAVDAHQVGVEGHSRFGKTALVAMAYDPRFAIVYSSSSGEGGAKLYRHIFGEQMPDLANTPLYHWFDGNFLRYGGPLTPADLPVDNHELIALCAPRPVFIGGGATTGDGYADQSGDAWADPQGMFLAEVAAGPVYRLLAQKILGPASSRPSRPPSSRRTCLPPASVWTHPRAQLARLPQFRQPLPPRANPGPRARNHPPYRSVISLTTAAQPPSCAHRPPAVPCVRWREQ